MASRNRYARRRGPLVLRHPGERPRYSRKTGRSTREYRPPSSYDLNSEHRTGSVFPSDSWRAGPRGMRSTGRQPDKVFSPSRESLRELRLHQATSTGSKPSWLCKVSAMGSAMVFILFSFTEVGEGTRAQLAPCSERSIRGPPSPHLEERMPRATAGIPLHYSAQARSKTCNEKPSLSKRMRHRHDNDDEKRQQRRRGNEDHDETNRWQGDTSRDWLGGWASVRKTTPTTNPSKRCHHL